MRNIKLLSASLVLLGAVSCTLNFEDLNTNPNKITVGQVKAYNVFEPLLYSTGSYAQRFTWEWNNEVCGMTAYTAGATNQINQYFITDGNWQTIWDNPARYGYDCYHLIDLARNDGDKYLEALGLVLKVFHLYNLTCLFGDIPYSEAYQGPSGGTTTPKFDSQADVFDQLLADLETANSILAEGPKPMKTGLDKMYNDDAVKWRKFANSLKVRILCRIAVTDDKYWNEIQKILDSPDEYPVFTSNDDNAVVPFTGTDPYQSYWGTDKTTESDFTGHRLSESVINMMVSQSESHQVQEIDPRLNIWGTMRGSYWKGTIAGCSEGEKEAADDGAACPNYQTLCRNNADGILMLYSELLFIYAEGVEAGKLQLSGTAKSYYEAALRANIEYWAPYGEYAEEPVVIEESAITTFLNSSLASYDKAANNSGSMYRNARQLILSQKWLSQFWVAFEPYNEWRRNEFPLLTIGRGTNANDFELPTRFGYPPSSTSSNPANVAEALKRMGGDNNMHTALIWSYKYRNGGKSKPHHSGAGITDITADDLK